MWKLLLFIFFIPIPALFAGLTFTSLSICNGTSYAATFDCIVSVTAGDLLVVGIGAGALASPVGTITVSDTAGVNVWHQGASDATNAHLLSSVWYTVVTSTTSLTVRATLSTGQALIEIMPSRVTGQAASSFIDQAFQANSASATSLTCGTFTRTGNELIFAAASDASGSASVGWSTASSTGTFTFGPKIEAGTCCTPSASAYQIINSGTSYTTVFGVGANANRMTCAAMSIKEAVASTIQVVHRPIFGGME
jgi:hypothetical protein